MFIFWYGDFPSISVCDMVDHNEYNTPGIVPNAPRDRTTFVGRQFGLVGTMPILWGNMVTRV
nr:hypothetical protein [uncultured Allomuricauda sp.]